MRLINSNEVSVIAGGDAAPAPTKNDVTNTAIKQGCDVSIVNVSVGLFSVSYEHIECSSKPAIPNTADQSSSTDYSSQIADYWNQNYSNEYDFAGGDYEYHDYLYA